jgi:hypothetical protein
MRPVGFSNGNLDMMRRLILFQGKRVVAQVDVTRLGNGTFLDFLREQIMSKVNAGSCI